MIGHSAGWMDGSTASQVSKLALALMEIGKGYDDVSYEEVQLWLSVV